MTAYKDLIATAILPIFMWCLKKPRQPKPQTGTKSTKKPKNPNFLLDKQETICYNISTTDIHMSVEAFVQLKVQLFC